MLKFSPTGRDAVNSTCVSGYIVPHRLVRTRVFVEISGIILSNLKSTLTSKNLFGTPSFLVYKIYAYS
jgi:hypothetical protein